MDAENPSNGAPAERRCWLSEGVWGKSSCERLGKILHCKNCSVYKDAGERIFKKSDSARLPEVPAENSGARTRGKGVILFALKGSECAVEMSAVSGVYAMRTIHRLPRIDAREIAGIANIDGNVCIVANLGGILNRGGKSEDSRTPISGGFGAERLVVCEVDGERFAFAASGVSSAEAPADAFEDISGENFAPSFVRGFLDIGGRRRMLVDCALVAHFLARRRA